MLNVGDPAPRFKVPGTPSEVDLTTLLASGPVALFFFPKANTSG